MFPVESGIPPYAIATLRNSPDVTVSAEGSNAKSTSGAIPMRGAVQRCISQPRASSSRPFPRTGYRVPPSSRIRCASYRDGPTAWSATSAAKPSIANGCGCVRCWSMKVAEPLRTATRTSSGAACWFPCCEPPGGTMLYVPSWRWIRVRCGRSRSTALTPKRCFPPGNMSRRLYSTSRLCASSTGSPCDDRMRSPVTPRWCSEIRTSSAVTWSPARISLRY